ncbi:MAG: PAS domain S-box protein [Thermodesulfovibrionales bacterium]|nr:PAS domain S-box protein [Thermodesulfovibrionales bacterium]
MDLIKNNSEEELKRQNELITNLVMKSDWFMEDLTNNIKKVIEVASELIQTERVSVWRYNEDLSKIRCIALYERSLNRFTDGEELISANFPTYTSSHSKGKVIAATDVFIDPRTSEIPAKYFNKYGITSLLDSPVYVGGKLSGLLSFEHVGERRTWRADEERLAIFMATFVSLSFEIDERKRLENKLLESELRYRTIFEGSSEGFFIMKERFIDCNEQVCKIWGCSKSDVIGHTPADFSPKFQPDGRLSMEAANEYIKKAMSGMPQRFYWQHKRKDGVLIDTEISLTSLKAGKEDLIFATMIDISERKKIENALKEAEEKYRKIFENSVEGIFQTTPDGRFITANPALAKMYNYETPEEFIKAIKDIGKQLYYDPRDRIKLLRILKEKGSIKNFIVRNLRKDGTIFWVSINAKVKYDEHGNIEFYEGTVQDITEQIKLEEQLRQSQKMEAIGTLAGGVAHDFNNLLTVMMGYIHLMQLKLKDDEVLRSYLNQILAAVDKASNLTNSLLAFSRKQMISLKPIEINSLIKNLQNMLERIIGEDIELKVFLCEEDLLVMADVNQLEQVLINLAANARDAMPKGGLIIIETEAIDIDDDYKMVHGFSSSGKHALISFTDFGVGISKEIIDKIFEPFFTTKEPGKGSGLGLSMVYGIIKQHQGHINCYSEPNKGTTFKIYLPLTYRRSLQIKTVRTFSSLQGNETILLAEDDENLRNLTRYIIERYGYKVIEAKDGIDAVEKFKENKDSINLLLFDVIMPRLNGKEAYDEIVKLRSDIPIIFMSGYTANIIHKKGIIEEGLNTLFKPIKPTKLLEKIREVLSK